MKLDFTNITEKDFESKALEVFHFQAKNTLVYKEYIKQIGIKTSNVISLAQIPFLPIGFFKTHKVFHKDKSKVITFTSSGTTGLNTSRHMLRKLDIYETSFSKTFELFYGDIKDYCVLALLPSYSEREGSSLIYMTEYLIKKSEHSSSGFYLHNLKELAQALISLDQKGQKVILLGVSYALLDLLELQNFQLKNTIIIETGGMKGQRKEMIKEEFYKSLRSGFGVQNIHSEYGMTELLSQAYSTKDGQYSCPPWMKVFIRDIYDPFCHIKQGISGGIDIIDLANLDSCSFISTQDLGKINTNGTFSILGRFDNSDIRGCNLMVQ